MDTMEVNRLASFCLITYNQERFIGEAVAAALSQTYSPLEIIISDDCSTDATREIIRKMVGEYNGPHKVILNFNDRNMGLAGHVNKILYELSTGEYIFLAAGDDISLNSRVAATVEFFKKYPDVVAIESNLQVIDSFSALSSSQNYPIKKQEFFDISYYWSPQYQHLYGCTRTVRRKVIEAFPPLHPSCPTEDTPLLLRAFLLNKKVASIERILVKYRIHGNNISAPTNLKLMDVSAIFEQYDRDLRFALRHKYISRKEFTLIKNVLRSRKQHRIPKRSYLVDLRNYLTKSFKS